MIVRGEAGAAVQFGSTLFIGENADGYILDHELLKERSRGDVKGQGEALLRDQKKSGVTL